MSNTNKPASNWPTEQLVSIFDSIGNSTASLIISAVPKENGMDEVIIAMRGKQSHLIDTVVQSLRKDKDFLEVMKRSLEIVMLERILEDLSKLKGGQNEHD